jgi:hypothetical protein
MKLKLAILDGPANPDLRFLLGYNFYFTQQYRAASWEFLVALNESPKFDAARAFLKQLDRRARVQKKYRRLPHSDDEADRYGPEDPEWIRDLRRELGRPAPAASGSEDKVDMMTIPVPKGPGGKEPVKPDKPDDRDSEPEDEEPAAGDDTV